MSQKVQLKFLAQQWRNSVPFSKASGSSSWPSLDLWHNSSLRQTTPSPSITKGEHFSKAERTKNHSRNQICRQKQQPKTAPLYFSWVITPTEHTHSFDISNIKAIMPLLFLTMTDLPRVVLGIRKPYATSDSIFTIPSWVCDKSLIQEQYIVADYIQHFNVELWICICLSSDTFGLQVDILIIGWTNFRLKTSQW